MCFLNRCRCLQWYPLGRRRGSSLIYAEYHRYDPLYHLPAVIVYSVDIVSRRRADKKEMKQDRRVGGGD